MDFFYQHLASEAVLTKSHSPSLVILSVSIAIISAFTAFGISERIGAAKTKNQQLLWIVFGASTMGIGVWGMHFIGLLALVLPVPVSYNLNITLISVLPAIIATSLVLWIKAQAPFTVGRLWLCGLLLGLGIGLMHYIGMMAMELDAGMYHIKSMFMLSIVIAVLLATVALKIQSSTTYQQKTYQFIDEVQIYSAIVMGLAISGMHYTAMGAAVFVQDGHSHHHANVVIDTWLLTIIITAVMALSLLLAIMTPLLLRYRDMSRELLKNEESLRIAATAFQTQEAIMITDANARIVRVNDAFVQTTGFSEAEVIGKNPRVLKSGKHNTTFYENTWATIVATGSWSGEIWNRRKNGEVYPEWQTISAVKNAQDEVTHYVSFFSDITDFKKSEQAVEKLAFFDPLTNLPNRRFLYDRLGQELNIAQNFQQIGALLFIDLDRFKNINDSLGHSIGDELLVEVAQRLRAILSNHASAIRLGGDEFIVLIACQNESAMILTHQAKIIAENVVAVVSLPYLIAEHDLYISPSIGITLYTAEDDNVDLILKRADTAMYHAKDAGRSTYRFYQHRMQEIADARLTMEKNLRRALEKNEFRVHYQPQSTFTGEIIGAEALIRWQHEQGSTSPVEFIPIAEETGLIVDIGAWIIDAVCQQLKTWDAQGIVIPHIAINVSPKQFHQADFVPLVIKTIKHHHLAPSRIMLEITEGIFLKNIDEVCDKMDKLRGHGFSLSIDDFGTGYSSLSYLKRLPFDQLKIDQSFTSDLMCGSNKSLAIVQSIIVMADGLGLNLIVEGVETNNQLSCLHEHGCHFFQGYYFSRPLSPEQFVQYYQSTQNR